MRPNEFEKTHRNKYSDVKRHSGLGGEKIDI